MWLSHLLWAKRFSEDKTENMNVNLPSKHYLHDADSAAKRSRFWKEDKYTTVIPIHVLETFMMLVPSL